MATRKALLLPEESEPPLEEEAAAFTGTSS